ncbi:MAG: hypothetical protein L3J39_01220 [Verrucomicrobiales bacterium]|nr:hypothetical protein [Verrucomicrobiales bacterium]
MRAFNSTKSLVRRAIYLSMVSIGWLALAAKPQPALEDKLPQNESGLKNRVVIIRMDDDDIKDGRRFKHLRQLIKDAADAPAKAVVFDLNTGAGYSPETARFLMEILPQVKVPSVAYANPSALGLGALVALGSDRVYLSPVAVIGGAQPSEGVVTAPVREDADSGGKSDSRRGGEQSLSVLKAWVRSLAKQKGHRPQIAQAFIDSAIEAKVEGQIISAKGEMLTLTADEAVQKLADGKPVFAEAVVASMDELLKLEGLGVEADALTYNGLTYGEHLTHQRRAAFPDSEQGEGVASANKDKKAGVKGFGQRGEGSYAGKILVVRVGMDDLMITARFEFMKRLLKKARLEGAEALIFDMNTPGGRVWETAELMMRELQEANFPTYTFVNNFAESGGCLVAIATDHIYMKPAAQIGSALPVTAAGDLKGNMKQKVTEMLRDLVRNVAKLKGHDPDVAEAFVTTDTEVIKDGVVISEMGKVLHLSTEEATMMVDGKPLLAKGVVDSIEQIIALEGLKGEILRLEPQGLERLAHLIQKFSFILIIVGLAGAYMEMNAPGFGVPGVTSLLAFGLFFFGNHLAGNLAGYELAVLLVLGLVLIAVEIFILPGTLLPGLIGGILVVASLTMAMVDRFDFQFHRLGEAHAPSLGDLLNGPIFTLAIGLLGAIGLGVLLMRLLPRDRRLGGLVLVESLASGASLEEMGEIQGAAEGKAGAKQSDTLVGRCGVVSADLRPAGKGVFDGQLLDIVADGEFIEQGVEVRIALQQGPRLVVERVEQE